MKVDLIGKKIGMTRIFNEEGVSVPVTVLEIKDNIVTQVKTVETDGYTSVQVTTGSKHAGRVNKALAGHYAKAGVEAGEGLWEFRIAADEAAEIKAGDALNVALLEGVTKVDVVGTTKGKGFQGGVKRHNFSMQDATHGNSISHRVHGSTGQNQDPGKVFKGKKMAGHMGAVRQTTQNLELVRVDVENGLLLIKGAVPGSKGSFVTVRQAIK